MALAESTWSIGAVLAALRPDFPDVTISKIRFLEAEGLLEPARTPAGYRKFRPEDVDRLRYVLASQRDHYLPLRVIKEQLAALDRGVEVPRAGGSSPAAPDPAADSPRRRPEAPLRLSRAELLEAAGIEETLLRQLESYGLVAGRARGGGYDAEAVQIATAARRMSAYGVEPRHLRAVKAAADREVGLIEQVVTPLLRQRSPDARARAEEVARELGALSAQLHAALVRVGLQG